MYPICDPVFREKFPPFTYTISYTGIIKWSKKDSCQLLAKVCS